MKQNQIDLEWGGGNLQAIADLRTDDMILYTGQEDFHATNGGKCYYQSCSGLSGAGWVPDRPYLAFPGMYRVDCGGALVFDSAHPIFGHCAFVPFDYRSGSIPDDYPVIVWGEEITFLRKDDLASFLAGELELTEKTMTLRYIPEPRDCSDKDTDEMKIAFKVPNGVHFRARRVLEGIYFQDVGFRWPSGPRPEDAEWLFWRRLGLHPLYTENPSYLGAPARYYKVSGCVCRAVYDAADLATVEGLQAAAPANVVVLRPDLYIQRDEYGRWDAVTKNREPELGAFEITEEAALRAMRGDLSGVTCHLLAERVTPHAAHRVTAEDAADAIGATSCERRGIKEFFLRERLEVLSLTDLHNWSRCRGVTAEERRYAVRILEAVLRILDTAKAA